MKQQNPIFEGAAVAIVTPFRDGSVDYEALKRLIEWQIHSHTDAIVICGTTGESSTLTDDEHRDVIRFAVQTAEAEFRLLQEPAAMTRLMRLNCQRMPTKPAQMHCCL